MVTDSLLLVRESWASWQEAGKEAEKKDSQCESQVEWMAKGLSKIVLINIQLAIVSYSILWWKPPFPNSKGSVKLCYHKHVPRDLSGALGQNGRSVAVYSLGQSSEGRKCWSLEWRKLVGRQVAQGATQENISLPFSILRSVGENVEDFPLDVGWRLEPFHLDSKEEGIVRLLISTLILAMLNHLVKHNNNNTTIHPSIHLKVPRTYYVWGVLYYTRQHFYQILILRIYTQSTWKT